MSKTDDPLADECGLDVLLKIDSVKRVTGWSRSTIWREVKTGRFPEPVPTTEQRVGWLRSEVKAWLDAKIAARDSRHQRPMGPTERAAAAAAKRAAGASV